MNFPLIRTVTQMVEKTSLNSALAGTIMAATDAQHSERSDEIGNDDDEETKENVSLGDEIGCEDGEVSQAIE